jgi:anti-anti-sigma factor
MEIQDLMALTPSGFTGAAAGVERRANPSNGCEIDRRYTWAPDPSVAKPRSTRMTIACDRVECATIVRVNGRLDATSAADLERVCEGWTTPGLKNLILDFSGLDYISSAGLSVILGAGKAIDGQGGRLLICGLYGGSKRVFLLSGLDALFAVFESRGAALAECRQPGRDGRTSVDRENGRETDCAAYGVAYQYGE